MALFHITIEKVIVQDDGREVKKLLEKILCKLDGEGELEKQMDSWLVTLDKSIGKIEKVSDQVVSK